MALEPGPILDLWRHWGRRPGPLPLTLQKWDDIPAGAAAAKRRLPATRRSPADEAVRPTKPMSDGCRDSLTIGWVAQGDLEERANGPAIDSAIGPARLVQSLAGGGRGHRHIQ